MEKQLAAKHTVDPQVMRLVNQMGSIWPGRRKAAEEVLRQRGPEAVPELMQLFTQDRTQQKKRRRNYYVSIGLGVGAIILLPVLFMALTSPGSENRAALFGVGLILVLFGLLVAILVGNVRAEAPLKRMRNAARALTFFEDVRTVGVLAEALELEQQQMLQTPKVRQAAIAALTRLLPQIPQEAGELLTTEQRGLLQRAVSINNMDFSIVLLQTLTRIGIESDLPFVRNLANFPARSEANRYLQTVARDCLPHIETCALRENVRRTLLRPSSIPGTPADQLLRPATEAGKTDPAHLLRPSSNDGPTQGAV